MGRGRRPALVVAAALAALGACARPSPQTSGELFALDSFRWRAAATPQSTIVATNEWGDLRVRTAQRGGLVVSAMIQRIGTTQDELEIRVDEGADTVVVEVRPRVARPRGRVDLTLIVPPGKRLAAATRDGLAEIKYKGDVLAHSRAGSITLESPGHASAQSERGSITARLSGAAWREPLSFASGGGDISIWLPEDADVALRVATAGTLDVGFPHPAGNGALVETTLGDGGAELCIESATGDVRVVPYATAGGLGAANR